MAFYYRVMRTGEVLAARMDSPQPNDFLDRYAANVGVGESIEEFESEVDPRGPDARKEPAPPPPSPPNPHSFAEIAEGLAAAAAAFQTAGSAGTVAAVTTALAEAAGHVAATAAIAADVAAGRAQSVEER